MRTTRRRGGWAVAVLALVALLTACSDGGGEGTTPQAGSEQEDATVSREAFTGAPGGRPIRAATDPLAPGFGRERIVRTGEVELAVRDFQEGLDEVYDLARRMGGTVASSDIDDTGDRRGTVVLRVPSERFETTLRSLGELGDVRSQHVDTREVTEVFVDLRARARNAAAQERVLLGLMDRARTVGQTIRVQRELERVRELIERLQARLRLLREQTSWSTLTVEIVERGAPAPSRPLLARAWEEAAGAFLKVVSGVIVAAGAAAPLVLLAAAALVAFRALRPRGAGA